MTFLNHDADTVKEVNRYYDVRKVELSLLGVKEFYRTRIASDMVVQYIDSNGYTYKSIFVSKSNRGQGRYEQLYNMTRGAEKILTFDECNIEGFLEAKNIPHKVMELPYWYKLIRNYYGDKKTERSKVLYMNHILEGIEIIQNYFDRFEHNKNYSKEQTLISYVVHPISQNAHNGDKECIKLERHLNDFHKYLGNQYARHANAYLSNRVIESIDDIETPPHKETFIALLADKIQNYRDFLKYHQFTHDRRRELMTYFHNWFDKFVKEGLCDVQFIYDNTNYK